MDKYFTVKQESQLYKDYFTYREDKTKVNDAFKSIADKYEIETKEYYPSKNLGIVGTANDCEKFKEQVKKTGEFFKLKSKINLEWIELTKNIVVWRKPSPIYYLTNWISGRCLTRIFSVGDILYGSIEAAENFATEEWMQEMKASEFFKVIEDYKESEVK